MQGEANKYIKLFTKELGFITASAQGIRHAKSKLRYSLQDYSLSTVALVRGKEIWRLTNALRIANVKSDFQKQKELFLVFARIFALLERLLGGEERHEKLFMLVHDAFMFLRQESLSDDLVRNAEYLIVLRLLHELGYVGDVPACRTFLATHEWNIEVITQVGAVEKQLLLAINDSIRESQL